MLARKLDADPAGLMCSSGLGGCTLQRDGGCALQRDVRYSADASKPLASDESEERFTPRTAVAKHEPFFGSAEKDVLSKGKDREEQRG